MLFTSGESFQWGGTLAPPLSHLGTSSTSKECFWVYVFLLQLFLSELRNLLGSDKFLDKSLVAVLSKTVGQNWFSNELSNLMAQ